MKKVVGRVTEEEKRAIMNIYSHINSLEELLLILPHDSNLYKQANEDLTRTRGRYQEWWNVHSEKYKWERKKGDWSILFETNEITIEI
ncbi:MAG: CXXX repeat peptide modification system protein [Prevotella sp.]|nr:CXXX repeat peptide modification system protein [Prevotella sp.]